MEKVKMKYQILNGNSLELLKTLEDNSVDAIVTDPPYGLSQHSQGDIVNALTAWLAGEEYTHGKGGFMGKAWDSFVPSPMLFKECLRVLKHGGHMLCFAGARTQDLMGISIRLAGFELRDSCLFLYGSGFPKGQNIAKGVDGVLGKQSKGIKAFSLDKHNSKGQIGGQGEGYQKHLNYKPSEKAQQWQGWNTNLKPAYEPILMARKPLEGTVVENVLKHGVGGLNIDGCRVESTDIVGWGGRSVGNNQTYKGGYKNAKPRRHTQGRYPANVILDGSEAVEALFPYTKTGGGTPRPNGHNPKTARTNFSFGANPDYKREPSEGSASRYFYCAKASKRDRDEGLEGMNPHPTVKNTSLMRHLVRLVTPKGGVVLDPFMGSGSTGKACMYEGMRFIGMELSEEYVKIAEARIEYALNQSRLLHP